MKLQLPRKRVLLGAGVLCVFLFLVLGQVFLSRTVIDERDTIDELRTRVGILERDIQSKTRLVQAYKKTLDLISRYKITLPEDEVDFYSTIERELAKNGVQVNSMKPAKTSQGNRAVQVDFMGPYYALLNVVADWRSMGVAVRMVSMNIKSGESGMVSGVIILETVISEGGV